MPYTSRFFNSTDPNDPLYDASEFAGYFSALVRSGVFVAYNADELKVSASTANMNITIAPGIIFIGGYMGYIYNTGETFSLDAGSSQQRIDAVVMRRDFTVDKTGHNRAGSIYPAVIKGTPGAGAPALTRDNDVYEMCLAQIRVPANATNLSGATITDTRGNADLCGYASFYGQPPYQPPGEIPWLVWAYTVFPDQLTPEQRAMVEATPSWMAMYEGSRFFVMADNSHYVNPHTTAEVILSSRSWTCPPGVYEVDIWMVGGGEGGDGGQKTSSGGIGGMGAQAIMRKRIPVVPGQTYSFVVGPGGNGGNGSIAGSIFTTGSPGGPTTAFGTTANGGDRNSANRFDTDLIPTGVVINPYDGRSYAAPGSNGATINNNTTAGTGGIGALFIGRLTRYVGGAPGNPSSNSSSGGGGGGASVSAAGMPGGDTTTTPGNGGKGADATTDSTGAFAGSGGGGGGCQGDTGSGASRNGNGGNGGRGANGVIILYYTAREAG